MLEKTNLFERQEIEGALISQTLFEVYESLKERGYNPINQLVGYLVSGDPGYISSYKGARDKILQLDRTKILVTVLESYLTKWNV